MSPLLAAILMPLSSIAVHRHRRDNFPQEITDQWLNSPAKPLSLPPTSAHLMITTAIQPHQEFENSLLQRIANSDRYKMYQEAFRTATGLPLRLVSADPDGWCLDDQKINRSPFCEALNLRRQRLRCLRGNQPRA